MSHSILLVVPKPDEANFHETDRYKSCVAALTELRKKILGIETLGENVLLLPIDHTLLPLANVTLALKGVSYKYIIFDEEIEWHEVAK